MSPTRRQLLVTAFGSLGAAAVSGSLSKLALASTLAQQDRYFVFCYFPGAWDPLVSHDPKYGLLQSGLGSDITRIEHGWDDVEYDTIPEFTNGNGRVFQELTLANGTDTVTTAFQAFADLQMNGDAGQSLLDRTTFVRGLSMDTLTHEVGRRRFLTGRPPSGLKARGSSISTALAGILGAAEPIPNLSAAVESYNAHDPTYASALNVSSSEDLLRALRPADLHAAPEERSRVEALLQNFRECMLVERSDNRKSGLASRGGAQALVEGGYDRAFDLTANSTEMSLIRERFGIGGGRTDTVQARMAMAGQAITQGVSRVASVMASRSCDTHFDNWASDQLEIQMEGYRAIAALVDHLQSSPHAQGGTYADRTTIIAFSDFSRTPLRNGNGGRDHWLLGSCFLTGPDLNPGVFGASSDEGMNPMPVDMTTGIPNAAGEIAKPEHVLASLFNTVGNFDQDSMPNELRVNSYDAILNC